MPPLENTLSTNNVNINALTAPELELTNHQDVKYKTHLKWYQFETKIKPINAALIVIIHLIGFSTFFHPSFRFDYFTLCMCSFNYFYVQLTGLGVTGGVHRLWSHRSYTASKSWRVFLMLCFMGAGQNRISQWVLDHREHHKHVDTEADPHNVKRGFWFSHCGWLMIRKKPEVIEKGKQIDISDVTSDPVVQFSEKYYNWLKVICCFVIPVTIAMWVFNATFYVALIYRFTGWIWLLNWTWSVNSAAHLWGMRPYDKSINPAENKIVSFFAAGEGFHNYHHTFSWDYKTGESPLTILNTTTVWIDLAAKFGLVTNRRQPSKEVVQKTILRHGDGSHSFSKDR